MYTLRNRVISSLLLAASVGAQTTSLSSAAATATATVSPTLAGSQPCATVSSLLTSYSSAYPSATAPLRLPAALAYECSLSAPIVQDDALDLVDGLTAFLQWQSTLAYLKNPPSGYLLKGVDLLGGMQEIRDQVQAGAFTSEIEFETNLTNLIGAAQDGHLTFRPDGLGVFGYERGLAFASISSNGQELPEVWSVADLFQARTGIADYNPSSVVSIDGQNASDWLTSFTLNNGLGFQDPDALYNSLFYEVANADSTEGYFSQFGGTYLGATTNLTFANGTSSVVSNFAIAQQSFDGVDSGESYYQAFCNATAKSNSNLRGLDKKHWASASASSPLKRAVTVDYPRSAYPEPAIVSPDGSLAGYIINATGFEDVAVLSVLAMSESDPVGVKKAMATFLKLCSKYNLTKLVIDVQSNGGGDIIVGFDLFKQLFPTIAPFAAGNYRATPQYNILGSGYTAYDQAQLQKNPPDYTAFSNGDGYGIFDGAEYLDQDGDKIPNWAYYFGPVELQGDNFTRLVRWNISDQAFDEYYGETVSNTAGGPLPGQVFESDNIILFGDGQCSSTCTTFSHLLKWQGKVKSVVVGGRPQAGPQQQIGGVKGKQVVPLAYIQSTIDSYYTIAPADAIAAADKTDLKTLRGLGPYVTNRTADPSAASDISVNGANSIAEGDASLTPLQFVYEAADCRIYWQEEHVFSISSLWATVAEQAFGLNGTDVFSGCVAGSTGQNSSLSGQPDLYNGGVPTNVTKFVQEPGVPDHPKSSTAAASSLATATGTAGSAASSAAATSAGSAASATPTNGAGKEVGGSLALWAVMCGLGFWAFSAL